MECRPVLPYFGVRARVAILGGKSMGSVMSWNACTLYCHVWDCRQGEFDVVEYTYSVVPYWEVRAFEARCHDTDAASTAIQWDKKAKTKEKAKKLCLHYIVQVMFMTIVSLRTIYKCTILNKRYLLNLIIMSLNPYINLYRKVSKTLILDKSLDV